MASENKYQLNLGICRPKQRDVNCSIAEVAIVKALARIKMLINRMRFLSTSQSSFYRLPTKRPSKTLRRLKRAEVTHIHWCAATQTTSITSVYILSCKCLKASTTRDGNFIKNRGISIALSAYQTPWNASERKSSRMQI